MNLVDPAYAGAIEWGDGAWRPTRIASADPTVNDDIGAGYPALSTWINTVSGDIFMSSVDTVGAAEWGLIHTGITTGRANGYFANRTITMGTIPTTNTTTSQQANASIDVPENFGSILSLKVWCIVSASAAGPFKDIDITLNWGGEDEVFNTHVNADLATSYNLTDKTDKWYVFDITALVSPLATPGDVIGILMKNNGVGGVIGYSHAELLYIVS